MTLAAFELPVERCRVLSNDVFSLIVNCMLGFIALSSLLVKRRWFDTMKRSNKAFLFDVSKLFVSGTTGHMLNVFLSRSLDDSGDGDECAYYLVNYLLDFMFGVPLTMYVLRTSLKWSTKRGWTSLQRRGYYNDSLQIWLKQTVEFTGIVALVKIVLALPLFAMQSKFQQLGILLVTRLQHDPQLELFVVMLVVPTLLNVVQFLVFDQILMMNEMDDVGGGEESAGRRRGDGSSTSSTPKSASSFSLDGPSSEKDRLIL